VTMVFPSIVVGPPGPKAREVIARDEQLFGAWPSRPYPLVISKGDGVVLTDVDGNQFLDLNGLLGVNVLGYSNVALREAIAAQAKEVLNVGFCDHAHPLCTQAAQTLLNHLPGFERVFFGSSGAEAVDWALRLARWATKRPRVVAIRESYHGSTGVTWVTSGMTPRDTPLGLDLAVEHVSADQILNGDMERLGDPQSIAALLVEPVIGPTVFPLTRAHGEAVDRFAKRHGCLVIADEIQTSGFRTGPFSASADVGLVPDIMTLAKAISGGLPFSAVAVRGPQLTLQGFRHGSTYGANLVSCAASIAALNELDRMQASRVVADLGHQLKELLSALAKKETAIRSVKGRGLLFGVELDPKLKPDEVCRAAFRRGVLVLAGVGVVRVLPPYVVTPVQLQRGIELLGEAIRAVREGRP
jgi:4-aminobutyrate aminotransferase